MRPWQREYNRIAFELGHHLRSLPYRVKQHEVLTFLSIRNLYRIIEEHGDPTLVFMAKELLEKRETPLSKRLYGKK